MPCLLAAALLACGEPDRAPPSTSSSASTSPVDGAITTRDTVVRSVAPLSAPLPYDTTDYLTATEHADPDSVVQGRLAVVVVVDSAHLNTRGGTRTTALLVRLGPERHPRDGYYRVYVVESGPAGRHARATGLEALGALPPGRAGFGSVDVEGDGVREPYLASWTGGSGGYTITLVLQGANDRVPYWYELFGAWTHLDGRAGEFTGASTPAPRVRRWMTAHASRAADVVDPDARDTVVLRRHAARREWLREHGPGFVQGPLRVRWHAGMVPFGYDATCRTRDGDLQWALDGDVWAYDSIRDRHFLLRSFTRYDTPNGLVLGTRYVWLGTTAPMERGVGLMAYDRTRRRMVVVPVPELDRTAHRGCRDEPCNGPNLSVRNGRLYGDSVALTLPDSIVPAVEFPDTGRVCRLPRR